MEKYEPNCVFCKIVKGEIKSTVVYSDDYVMAIKDISPASPGHTLIIPKEHFASVSDTPLQVLDRVIEATKKVTELLRKEDNTIKSFNILNCSGKESGQSVYHVHFHVIPRRDGDSEQVIPKIDALLKPK